MKCRLIIITLFIVFYGVLSTYGEDYHEQGLEFFKRKDYKSAQIRFLKAYKKWPKNSVVAYNLGMTYYHLSEIEQALKFMDQALALNPKFSIAYYSKGVIYLNYGKKKKAILLFKKGCDLGYKKACTVYSNL